MSCVSRDGEDLDSQGDGSSQPDTISIASRTSQNTLDSDKVSHAQPFTGSATAAKAVVCCEVASFRLSVTGVVSSLRQLPCAQSGVRTQYQGEHLGLPGLEDVDPEDSKKKSLALPSAVAWFSVRVSWAVHLSFLILH